MYFLSPYQFHALRNVFLFLYLISLHLLNPMEFLDKVVIEHE
ncbi:hypothetical protein Patl1_35131 [Pistacia atlantica]|uniref:Uncharacterized protein n=1 Tax=Pistacia atlantica TaxID=434234 RepID=A0ACC0ZRZ9_9ROSI|nr:hypothetical protein Patl1_35131 [Pistacia atlantica]